MTQHPHLQLRNISKAYPNGVQALQAVNLDIQRGEIFGIIGRSGAGKSTLLRLFNRLESADGGEICIHGIPISGGRRQLRDLRRRVAMIFQHFNLLSTRTVAENVALPLRMAGIPAAERQRRVDDILRLVGLESLRDSWPSQLSGGQKQRAGIARALVTQPEILLCDEATSALDPENTLAVLSLLKEINQRLGLTIVLITHEMDVIRTLCDQVAVLEKGQVIEQGEVWRVFGDPQHEVTRGMLGTLHHGRAENGELLDVGQQFVTLHFNGVNGLEPDLREIARVLGGSQLIYSSCEPIQGRIVGQLKLRVEAPLSAEALRLAAGVADRVAVQVG
ncbi:MAG: methionine ABC transporter ATP-binding protein [Kluyvera sp.]|uniref:methionine ABC transporter ATP-binding protein n=1 Tax=Kluyvera sp. TaxID=1538228 RepID=UPI003F2EECC5